METTDSPNLYEKDVSGLWGHSHDEKNDLMKRYVVEKKTPSGWLALQSFADVQNTANYLLTVSGWDGTQQAYDYMYANFRVVDQFNNVYLDPYDKEWKSL